MQDIDAITQEVIRGYFVSTVQQMRATLLRTAYAPILYEALDFSCGLMNDEGEVVGMSEDFSGHVFAMNLGLKAVLEKFEGKIYPGDVLAVNDPYTGGTHLNDIAFYTPFFADGRALIFIGVRAHFADVGGATPGSFSGQDTEIYQEGVRIVPVKLVERGQLNQGLWDVLFANMRLTEEREGDALAILDTSRVAEIRLSELCDKYGPQTVEGSMNALLDSAEQTMRERTSELLDGEYYYEHYMDNSGLSPEPLPIKAKLTIDGDTMAFDFTGTCPQVVGPMNCGLPVSQGGVFVIVKSWLDPKTPVNGGTFRPLKFVIPEGSILGAQLPAPVGGCWEVYSQVQTAVIGLFAQVMPDNLGAENLGTSNHVNIAGFDTVRNRPYILYEYPAGGNPGASDADGTTGNKFYDSGDTPSVYAAESAEQRDPVLVETLEVLVDGEGPGRHRSGFGVTRRIRVLSDNSQLNVMADRTVIPPWGAAGAYPGRPNSHTVIREGREVELSPLPGKVKSFPLRYGDVIVIQASAGGGVGDPLDRDVSLVKKEVLLGYTTLHHARDIYGVVLDGGEVNLSMTQELRHELRKRRHYFTVVEATADDFDERGCRFCRLGWETAAKVGVEDGDMIEYVGKSPAPLRAWVQTVDGLPLDSVPIGPIGRRILKLAQGDEVWVRALRTKTAGGPIATASSR